MAVKIKGSLTEGLTAEHQHGPSGDTIKTTAPKDNGGTGEHFSPTDLLATSLGACMITIMSLAAKKRDLNIAGTSFEVEKHMTSEAPRRIAKLVVSIQVPYDFTEEEQAALAEAAKGCPVCRSISSEIEIALSFEFGSAKD